MSADVISKMTRELSKLKILSIEQVVQPFPAPPILNIFLWKLYGLVLELVGVIDAKGIDMAQPIWLWGCPA